jgi:ribosome-associated protein
MTQDTLTKCIELNTFLRIVGIQGTGGKIKLIIRSGSVKVNEEVETRNKRKLHADDIVEYSGKRYKVEEGIIKK